MCGGSPDSRRKHKVTPESIKKGIIRMNHAAPIETFAEPAKIPSTAKKKPNGIAPASPTRAMTSNVVSGIDSSAFNLLNDKVIEQFYPDPSEIKPNVVINDGCFCSGSSVGCFSLCSDGSVPSRIATIYASILVSGPLLGDRNAETSLDIQLR